MKLLHRIKITAQQKLIVALRSEVKAMWHELARDIADNSKELTPATLRNIIHGEPKYERVHTEILELLASDSGESRFQVESKILFEVHAELTLRMAQAKHEELQNRIAELKESLGHLNNLALVREFDPPSLAEWLVACFTKRHLREGLLQCLDEDFRTDLAAGISIRRAKIRYWGAALNCIGPQLWAAVKRIGLIGVIANYVRGKFGGA